jgi:flagellar biosynthesis GTPase FlhF
MIVFTDANSVIVDGQNAGNIVSVLSNYPLRKAEILKAFADFRTQEKSANDAKLEAANKANQEALTKLAEDKQKEAESTAKANQEALDKLAKEQQDRLDKLAEEQAKLKQDHEDELKRLANEKAQSEAAKAELESQVAELVQYRPFDPNVIQSEAFYERIQKDELFSLAIMASQDETCKGILGLLSAYKDNAWPVVLDDKQVVGAMQYLTAIGLLEQGRAEEITRPATREEAYTETKPE